MIPRLYVDQSLQADATIALAAHQAHYLRNVLRRETGGALLLFNAKDGEFSATLTGLTKNSAEAQIGERLRAPAAEPDVILLIAPIKRAAIELVIQKATELGVSGFSPVVTDRTNSDRLRPDRLRSIALEAAEQCGRFSVPAVNEPAKLAETLLHWAPARTLFFCDEAGDDPSKDWGGPDGRAEPLIAAAKAAGAGPAAILIGPEGGFTPDERKWLHALAFVRPVTLGPRILRADTAAIVSLALWQSAVGDLTRR